MAVLLSMLLVLKVASFLRECKQVGEDQPTKTDMVKWVDGVGLDVLSMIGVQSSMYCTLQIVDGEHRLHMVRQFLNFQSLDLIVEVPQCHLLYRDPI